MRRQGQALDATLRFDGHGVGGSLRRRNDMTNPAKNTICLWYDRDAEEAARFYARTFPDSAVGAVYRDE